MSSKSSQLNRIMKECYNRQDVGGALDAFNSYQSSQCYNPRKQRIFDSHTQTFRTIEIACGQCYHCQETKINEWVTRMYAHLEDFKHVYFITLTYSSFYKINEVTDLIVNKLSDAVWHWDNFNSTHKYSYNPCLLIKSHYQNFIKRLRKNTGINDLTYVLTGEYGTEYGRPHFHAILFSNSEISQYDIKKAWSVSLWRDRITKKWSYRRNQRKNGDAYDISIGRIDFNDLVTNGTLNTATKIRVDNTYMNAANCFSYVCKYVCKNDLANNKRVSIAFKNLFQEVKMCNDPALGIVPFHVSCARCEYGFMESLLTLYNSQSYYENLFYPSLELYGHLEFNKEVNLYGSRIRIEFYPTDFKSFVTKFAPFVEFSRGVPIGSVFARTHLPEFTEGVFNKPILQERGFVIPSYFRRKAQEHVYGLRKVRKSLRGVTYPKTGLIDLYRRIELAHCDVEPLRECVPYWDCAKDYDTLLQDSEHVFKDLATNTKVLLVSGRAMSFRYNRCTRHYDKVAQIPLQDWLKTQLDNLRQDFRNYRRVIQLQEQTQREKESAFYLLCRTTHQTTRSLRHRFADKQNEYLSRKQCEYDRLHVNVE